jgi:hypothetical protein
LKNKLIVILNIQINLSIMSTLLITTGYEDMNLTPKDAINLELCLNVTTVGHDWKDIGDVLYNFGSNQSNAKTNLIVSENQFNFLQVLRTKTWQTAKSMTP